MHPFFIALQFLTRIPLNPAGGWQPQAVGRSVLYYPLVGLLLGCLLYFVAYFIDTTSLLSAAIILTLWVLLTGGLHLDGLADSADAWAGGFGNKDKTLAIMKDPRSGPLAVVVLVLVLFIKFAAIDALIQSGNSHHLLVPLILARSYVLALFLSTTYVRENGSGSAMADYLPRKQAWVVIVISVIGCWLIIDLVALVMLSVVTFATFYGLRYLMIKRIEGLTGDTAGAMIELIEAISLSCLVIYFN